MGNLTMNSIVVTNLGFYFRDVFIPGFFQKLCSVQIHLKSSRDDTYPSP